MGFFHSANELFRPLVHFLKGVERSGHHLILNEEGNYYRRLSNGALELVGAAPEFVGCSLGMTSGSTQPITPSLYTDILWPVEFYDTHGFHSTSVDTNRITIPSGQAGEYRITALAYMDTTTTMIFSIFKNGSQVRRKDHVSVLSMETSYELDLDEGDYLSVAMYHLHGSARNVQAGGNSVYTNVQVSKIG